MSAKQIQSVHAIICAKHLPDVVLRKFILPLIMALIATALLSACAGSEKIENENSSGASVARKSIRFYSANKRGQEDRLVTIRNTQKYGCQNLSRFRRAYRVAVIGFKTCVVFSEQNCPAKAAVLARWDGRARRDPNKQFPTTKLTAGTSWIIGKEGQKKWSCK